MIYFLNKLSCVKKQKMQKLVATKKELENKLQILESIKKELKKLEK